MKKEKQKGRGTELSVKRLLLMNAVALLGLLVILVLALWMTGLLGSVIAFIF